MAKKFLSILLVLVLVLGLLPAAGAAALSTSPTFSDMPDNWATEALESAVANGLLVGDDGKIMPDSPLTRAQMATIIARAFGATKEGDISEYADVKSTDWFAGSMAKAYKMGVMQDYAGKMEPNSNISREQAFVVLARALKLEPASVLSKSFEDEGEISDWAKGEVYALVNAGYIQGSNGKLNPKANISRAEFAQMMHNLIKQYIKAEGEYTEVANGNIMVNVPGVTLKNVTINGDLIVGDGVGDGNLTLDNVTIKGRLLARGGGVNSITIIGGSVEGKVIVAKVDGDIRVSVEGGADVEVIVIDDGKDDVIIEGTVGTVQITAAEVPVVIQNATVEKIEVVASGATNITVANGAAVTNVVVNSGAVGTTLNIEGNVNTVETSAANTAVSGTGTVSTVTAKEGADHTAVTTPNTKVNNEGASGVTAGGGKEVPENGSVINNSQGTDITTPPSGGGPSYVAISAISVEGDAVVGATLTAKVTPDKATVNYEWMRSESENEGYAPINDATDSTYELVAADVGKYIKVKATGTGNYKGTVESKPVGPVEPASEEPEVLEATWNDTGKVGTNTIDETAYVFQGFELLDSETNAQIALVASNIAKMTVLDPGAEEAKELEVGDDSDPLLWFNVRKAGGDYKYTVETKDGDVYEATLTWTAPVTATAEKTGEPAENEERKAIYQLYTVAVDVDPEDSKVYQIKPNGEISELAILTDSDNHLNIWFKVKDTANDDWKQLEGEHTFLIKKGDAWSEAVINYQASEEPEVLEATWNDTGKVGTNTIDETAYVFQGFELLDSETNAQIALVASNIAKMTVLDPGAEEAKELEVGDDSDPLLWFNVRKAGGDYKYTVETKDGDVYEATLTWTAPVTATAEKTGEPAENEERKAIYQLYTVAVDVDPEDSKVYQIKPNGEISELAILTDSDNHLNIWFKVKDTANDDWKQLEGEHTFLIKKGDAWSEAVIEYKEPTQSEYGFEITGTDQDFVAGGLLEGTVIEGENGVNTEGLTPVEVTLKATTINELGYDNVKVLAPEVTGEGTLQFWAYSADDGLWFDAAVHGWGSGFPITADYNVTTPIYVFADTAGTYEVTFKLVEWSESGQVGEPITTITATITVISQEMANAINAAKNAIKPSWAVDRVEPVDDEALPSGVENVDYKVTIKTSYENKGEAQASGRTVTTLFTIPDGVTVWYPVWEDGKLTYISASSGEVALGMVGHPLNEENIDADGIVYVDLGETTETKFTVTIKLIDADEDWQGVVYGEQELEIEVPEVSEYGFEFEDNIEIIAGGLLDGYVYESEDGQSLGDLDVSDLTAVKVTLKATAEKDMGYKKVRILPLKVEGPDNSNLQAWMYDSEDKKWYDMVQTGWGSEGTGFKLDANENKEMTIYVFADTPGTYGLTFKAVDIKDGDKEITVGTATIFAPFHFDADTGTISNYVGNEENITIPATINGVTVKAIGAKTFEENTSIKTVTFAEGSQLEAIGDNAFKHCTNLESIDLPSTVKSIGSDAFLSCKLTTGIDISNVGSIGAWAFGGCKFTEITIPEGCNVGNYAFGYCGQLNKIIVGSGVSLGAYLVYYYEGDTDYGFMDAYTAGGEGTYVFEDGAWKKQ